MTGLGAVVALVIAAVLARRGETRAVALLAVVALLAFAVLYIVIQALFMPVNVGTVTIRG